VFIKCAWVSVPGVAMQQDVAAGTVNSLFERSENVTDAIVVNMPLSPPHPQEGHGTKLRKFTGHQRMCFAQVVLHTLTFIPCLRIHRVAMNPVLLAVAPEHRV
jgi:hypothetical protein